MMTDSHDAVSPYPSGAEHNEQRDDLFAATLAHELRNPLSAVLMALDMLHPVCMGQPAARSTHHVAERASRQMERIIDDLLNLHCGGGDHVSGGSEPAARPRQRTLVDLAAVTAGALAATRPLFEAAGHRLSVSLPPEAVSTDVPASRLEQILTNLLANAAKYTEPGGGRVALSIVSGANGLIMRVRDNGIGIPSDLLPRIFDLYEQGAQTKGGSQGGLGIGLALVKSLVSVHGGRIDAYSDGPGRGAEFIVRLPGSPPSGHR